MFRGNPCHFDPNSVTENERGWMCSAGSLTTPPGKCMHLGNCIGPYSARNFSLAYCENRRGYVRIFTRK
jgi:hypothetical protein